MKYFVVEWFPDLEDIPKTTDTFWQKTTLKKLGYSPDHTSSNKVNVYKDPGTSFIRCSEIDIKREYIHILQQDGTIQEGIFRHRDAGGSKIGSQYFRRSGREQDRMYQLYRMNNTGNIHYHELILCKDEQYWRILAECSFNPETLDWTKGWFKEGPNL